MMAINPISPLLIILLSIISESHGALVTEEILHNLMSRDIILPTGKTSTLGDLYHGSATVENFNPGRRFLQLLLDDPNAKPQIAFSRIPDSEYLQDLDVKYDYIKSAYDASKTNKMVLIKGDPLAGKTRALRIIETLILDEPVPSIAVYADLSQITTSITMDLNTLTADDILKNSIPEDFVDLIKNIAEVNPSRVKILIDGVDQVPSHIQDNIFSSISELHAKDINTIVSSSMDIKRASITQPAIVPKTFEIPSTLSNNYFEMFTTHYWTERLPDIDVITHVNRLSQYTRAFRILIEETPLPRSIGVVQKLAELAIQPNSLQPFPSVQDYLEHPEIYKNPKEIVALSDRMRLSKMAIYDTIFEHLQPQLEVYGPEALNMMLKPIQTEWKSAITSSRKLIAEHGPNAYKFLLFEGGVPVAFIHPEYKRYFAAKYMLNSFTTDVPLAESFKIIITDPKHIFVTEFIDSGANMEHINRMRTIFSNELSIAPNNIYRATDNFIEYRLDNLCSEMFKVLGKKGLRVYLNEPSSLQSRNKYSFGMMSEIINVDQRYYIPRKTPWTYSGTRTEMFIHLEMVKSAIVAKSLKFKISSNIKVEFAAKVNYKYFQNIVGKAEPGRVPVEVLNKAMYESITMLGKDSIRIMKSLRRLGANPRDVVVNGRTLAHAAAKFHDRELLKVVHEEFGVSLVDRPDNNGQTILFELLESELPFNTYIHENAWESIEYLAEHGDLSYNRDLISSTSDKYLSFSPQIHEIPEPYLKLLIYNHGTPAERETIHKILKDYIPLEKVDISPDVLSLRRKLIIKNCIKTMMAKTPAEKIQLLRARNADSVSVSEMILSHKSLMGNYDFQSYKNTMKHLLLKEIGTFTQFQLRRTFTVIMKNTIYDVEILEIKNMVRVDVQPQITEPIILDFETIISRRMNQNLPTNTRGITLDSYIIETAYDLQPQVVYNNPENEIVLNRNSARPDEGYDSPLSDDAFVCDL